MVLGDVDLDEEGEQDAGSATSKGGESLGQVHLAVSSDGVGSQPQRRAWWWRSEVRRLAAAAARRAGL